MVQIVNGRRFSCHQRESRQQKNQESVRVRHNQVKKVGEVIRNRQKAAVRMILDILREGGGVSAGLTQEENIITLVAKKVKLRYQRIKVLIDKMKVEEIIEVVNTPLDRVLGTLRLRTNLVKRNVEELFRLALNAIFGQASEKAVA